MFWLYVFIASFGTYDTLSIENQNEKEMVKMSKLFKLIHRRKNTSNTDFISIKQRLTEVYNRFAEQNGHCNVFYVVLNGIAMPVAS